MHSYTRVIQGTSLIYLCHHISKETKMCGFPTTTETLICPGWETLVVPVSQPGTPGRDKRGSFCPGSGNRDKRCCQRHVAGAPFCPGWCYQPGQKISFFMFYFSQFFFYFNYTFAFQLNLCIGIQCV